MDAAESRRVVGNISLSLDGRVNGPGGDYDMSWIVPHAITETSRDQLAKLIAKADTALLGRKNYQGFSQYWPPVAEDETADPRDRAFSAWLNRVEKIVFSTTLTGSDWTGTRVVGTDPAEEVRRLRARGGGDIVVLSSASIIRALLAAELLDRLSVTLCPVISGGGDRLFDGELPPSNWSLAELATADSGACHLHYERIR